jgi:hypothetical protein
MADSIKPSPRNGFLGWLADNLAATKSTMNQFDLKHAFLPGFVREHLSPEPFGAGELLGKMPDEVNEWSYGNAPMHVPPTSNIPQFKRSLPVDAKGNRTQGPRYNRAEGVTDTLLSGLDAYGVSKVAPTLARGANKALGSGLEALVANNPFPPAPVARPAAVRRKGGNFNTERLNGYLSELGVDPKDGINDPVRRRMTSTSDWGNTQLRNYIRKDLGAPTDPLLEVEKQYPGMHLPEGQLPGDESIGERYAYAMRGKPGVVYDQQRRILETHAELAGIPSPLSPEWKGRSWEYSQQPGALTPWGEHSSAELYAASPKEYMDELSQHNHPFEDEADAGIPEWLKNADEKTTKIWGPMTPHEDVLGFGHVLDYLDAAQKPWTWDGLTADELLGFYKSGTPWDTAQATSQSDLPLAMDRREYERMMGLHNAGLLLSPEQIARTSVADAVRKTAEWNKFLAEQGKEDNPNLSKGIAAVHKEYPEGLRWVRLGTTGEKTKVPDVSLDEVMVPTDWPVQPGKWLDGKGGAQEGFRLVEPETGEIHGRGLTEQEAIDDYRRTVAERMTRREQQQADHQWQADLEAGLNAEGDAMGHCVGGYCDDVAANGVEIYSLRDKNNNPHVTVEAQPGKPWWERGGFIQDEGDWMARPWHDYNKTPTDQWPKDRVEFYKGFPGWLQQNHPDIFAQHGHKLTSEPPPNIFQIKGKGNQAPVDKYLPYVQDFVKGGNWGDIYDIKNAGLTKVNRRVPLLRGEADRQVGYNFQDVMGHLEPGVYTRAELREAILKAVPDHPDPDGYADEIFSTSAAGYAHGGSVVPRYSKKAELLQHLD